MNQETKVPVANRLEFEEESVPGRRNSRGKAEGGGAKYSAGATGSLEGKEQEKRVTKQGGKTHPGPGKHLRLVPGQ